MKVVLCNCPPDKASDIAKQLVEEKIAACVNVIPGVKSFYHWDGKLCEDKESTLLIKIRKNDFKRLESKIVEIHPYDVPEIVELNISEIHLPYSQWLYQVTQSD